MTVTVYRRRGLPLFGFLAGRSWWLSVVLAVLVFVALRYGLPRLGLDHGVVAPVVDGAPIAAVPFLLTAAVSLVKAVRRRRLLDRQTGRGSIRALSWRQFELLCGELYRRQGFSVVENGLGGADGGVDLILGRRGETWLVQCKHWSRSAVGVREIRELYGVLAAEGADCGVLVTSGGFTADALDFAAGKPLELIDGRELAERVREVRRPAGAAPACPQCGGRMVSRVAKQGGRAGQRFWGCARYPACRGRVDGP